MKLRLNSVSSPFLILNLQKERGNEASALKGREERAEKQQLGVFVDLERTGSIAKEILSPKNSNETF